MVMAIATPAALFVDSGAAALFVQKTACDTASDALFHSHFHCQR
jgi:hypothetical protein